MAEREALNLEREFKNNLVLHGAWLTSKDLIYGDPGCLFLWFETITPDNSHQRNSKEGSPTKAIRQHPHSLNKEGLKRLLKVLEKGEPPLIFPGKEREAILSLPTLDGRVLPSLEAQVFSSLFLEIKKAKLKMELWKVTGIGIQGSHIIPFLPSLRDLFEDQSIDIILGHDLYFWASACDFVIYLLTRERFLPAIAKSDKGGYFAYWEPVLNSPEDKKRLEGLTESIPLVCLGVEASNDPNHQPKGVTYDPYSLIQNFIYPTTDGFIRTQSLNLKSFLQSKRLKNKYAKEWLKALLSERGLIELPSNQAEVLHQQWGKWAEQLGKGEEASPCRLCLKLNPPPEDDKEKKDEWRLEFFLQSKEEPSLIVPAEKVWQEEGDTLRYLGKIWNNPQERLLTDLGYASRLFPLS